MLDTLFMLFLSVPPQEAAKNPRLLTVTAAELMESLADPPVDNLQREPRLVAAFQAAFAAEDAVRSVPLDRAVVDKRRAAARDAVRAELVAAKAEAPAIEAALAETDARFDRLGGNVFAILPGKTKRVIVFAAHYDSVPRSRGVIDNWASCMLLVQLHRALEPVEREHTFWFLGFAGHEDGGVGSASFVASLRAKQAVKIDACVTIDCAGASAPMAWSSGSSAGILEVVADAASRAEIPLRIVDFEGGGADSCTLRDGSLPVAALLGVDVDKASLLHGPGDQLAAIVPEHLLAMHRLTVALATELDTHLEPLHLAYVQDKLQLADAASGRKPRVPQPISWPVSGPIATRAATLAAPTPAPQPPKTPPNTPPPKTPPPKTPPPNDKPKDGSPP
ncbi:MAG: M28 family peptidase [Myxococcales bacterium]|nr:M28 family peptidase [Myxococcales bacterium]